GHQHLVDAAGEGAAGVRGDADFGLGLARLVIDVAPQAFGRGLRERRGGAQGDQAGKGGALHASAASVSISTRLPARAVRISVAVSGKSLAKEKRAVCSLAV